MKVFALFLSFYIILLSGIPCVDVVMHDSSQEIGLSQNTTQNHSGDEDCCSPFCTCQCCQANCYISSTPVLSPTHVMEITYYEYIPRFQSVELSDFLIPPKA